MKIVLREDVDNLGAKGDLVEVADGYARNYLVPRGLALPASKGVVQQAEAMRRNREARDRRQREAAEALAGRLVGAAISLSMRAGEGGKLFGSVTAADVAEALSSQLGTEIDRKHVELTEAIKELGEYQVTVRLHPAVTPTVTVAVVAQ